jgi:hypothetical protein
VTARDPRTARHRLAAIRHHELRPPATWWSVDEARAFLEFARNSHDPPYAAYVLILVLGLRHSQIAVTMELYSEVPSEATQDALKPLGQSLDG